ncbi:MULTISPECIES: type II toxin-antitoxin system HicB family antitoxin [unclassified Hyphomonas]|uniref:type II toxin-antitoxin system HicB family antitoxin n=1 Tax=unclassified Hyphomonas TaxID=2630699 RepID=UPI000458BAE2|nr:MULTISPECIES: type II toxin-antitoxin system HicB family antitoxin [unclassified Hyphomonas]KCZ46437.1 hypothetical protein HY17_09035 [Hyphomonas sp. CY54-11-8]
MAHYVAIVHAEDGAYGAYFPDVPGCITSADTLEELKASANEALALWVEDQALPEARSLDEIHDDPDIRADLTSGAFLMIVPLVDLDARTVRANITMEAGLLRSIDEIAKERGLTRSGLLAQAARKELLGATTQEPDAVLLAIQNLNANFEAFSISEYEPTTISGQAFKVKKRRSSSHPKTKLAKLIGERPAKG